VNLRGAPESGSELIGTISQNTSLWRLEEQRGWSRIVNISGRHGWIHSGLLSQTVVHIHKNERELLVMQGDATVLSVKVLSGGRDLGSGRYFGQLNKNRLALSWPNRQDLRDYLAKGQMTYTEYVRALRNGSDKSDQVLALCSMTNKGKECGALLSTADFMRLKAAIPRGGRVEIYESRQEDLIINSPDDLSRRIYLGAVKQLEFPAAGLGPDSQGPRLSYPGGDIQPDFATSADIVIRAVREAGVDLQALVHEDVMLHPKRYAGLYLGDEGAGAHRQIPVMVTYLKHHALSLPLDVREDFFGFEGGDIVAFSTGATSEDEGEPNRVGVVSETFNGAGFPLVITVWDMGQSTSRMDLLGRDDPRIIGHFRMTHQFDYQ